MAIAIETNAPARIVEIDGVNIAFDETDLKMARIHVQKDGHKGPLKKDDLIEWFKAEQPFYDIPEPAEKKAKVAKDDSNEVTAVLNYRVIGKNGSLNKTVHSIEITKAMIRAERKGLRGRPSADNYLSAAKDLIEPTMAPFEIVDSSSNVYEVHKTEEGQLSASRSKAGTEAILRARLAELESQLEKYQNELDERDDSE